MLLRRARLLVLAVVGATLVLHCGFPEPLIEGEGEIANGDSSAETSTPTDVPDSATDSDAGPTIDAAYEDALARDEASTPRPDAGVDSGVVSGCAASGADPCDCDGDGVKNGGPSCAPPPGKKADCDDFDKLVFPGQLSFVAAIWDNASPVKQFDWDCDGTVQKQFAVNVPCSLANCGDQGFEGDPACGQPGKYIFCTKQILPLGVLCTVTKTETRTQGCR